MISHIHLNVTINVYGVAVRIVYSVVFFHFMALICMECPNVCLLCSTVCSLLCTCHQVYGFIVS